MPDAATPNATIARQEAARHAIAGEVRAEMARQRKSLRDIAAVLGISHEAVRQRTTGEVPFRADELVLLGEHLGIPAEQFLTAATPAGAA